MTMARLESHRRDLNNPNARPGPGTSMVIQARQGQHVRYPNSATGTKCWYYYQTKYTGITARPNTGITASQSTCIEHGHLPDTADENIVMFHIAVCIDPLLDIIPVSVYFNNILP